MAGSKGKSGGVPASKKKRSGRKRVSQGPNKGQFGTKQGKKSGKGTKGNKGRGNPLAPWLG